MLGFGKKKPAASHKYTDAILLSDGGQFDCPVAGESNCQPAIAEAFRISDTDSGYAYFAVLLVREPRNRFDRNAIRVDGPAGCVGYLSRETAETWAPYMDEHRDHYGCRAKTIGGPARGVPLYGVVLDLPEAPPE